MILIADSGSTKTTWCTLSNSDQTAFYQTSGINPFFRTSEDIQLELTNDLLPQISGTVEKVYFYGAGVVNAAAGEGIVSALKKLFPKAKVWADSDLLAAARSLLQDEPGIACILGTGSNSCYYNGTEIEAHVPPLGFILGDEGSGAVLGKKLLADYLKGLMPDDLASLFRKQFSMDYGSYLIQVYRKEKPNMFLAGMVPFLKQNIEHDYCRRLVEDSFAEFINRNVRQYPDYKNLPVSFTGSVAYYFREQLTAQLEKAAIKPGYISKAPMLNLIKYHAKHN